jgi:hypothetical protein
MKRYKSLLEYHPYYYLDHLLNAKLNADSNTLQHFLNDLKYYKKELDSRIKEVEVALKEQKEWERNN